MTKTEVALKAGVSENTVKSWIIHGLKQKYVNKNSRPNPISLKAEKVDGKWFIKESDFNEFMESRKALVG